MPAKPRAINRANVLMGFEIEGLVHPQHLQDLLDTLSGVYGEHGGVETDHDGSVKVGANDPAWVQEGAGGLPLAGTEIVTPPVRASEAIDLICQVFDILRQYQADHRWFTNETCGFHVNISHKVLFADWEQDTRHNLAYLFLRRFETESWLERFKRKGNLYCKWDAKPATLDSLFAYAGQKMVPPPGAAIPAKLLSHPRDYFAHHTAVSLKSLGDDIDDQERRVEVRCAGGKGYEAHPNMRDYLESIYTDFLHALRNA